MSKQPEHDVAIFEALAPTRQRLLQSIGQVVVGQQDSIDMMLTALFSGGHALFVGVPGLAKTLLVKTVAEAIGGSFGRIQFTPDLMPADVTGVRVLEEEEGRRVGRFVKGPVFCNLLLADEINRTPPKTQAALLEAMQERFVTVGGESFALDAPFAVLATQNPIEQEGTYPLPEAQQDRFMFSIAMGYPSEEEERTIVMRTTVGEMPHATAVLTCDELVEFQSLIRRLPHSPDTIDYCVRLVRATRGECKAAKQWIRWGAGPRASQVLASGARTWAALRGHEVATPDDVRCLAMAALRHRIVLNFEAEAVGIDADKVVESIIEEVG